jgi:hypothetical protein
MQGCEKTTHHEDPSTPTSSSFSVPQRSAATASQLGTALKSPGWISASDPTSNRKRRERNDKWRDRIAFAKMMRQEEDSLEVSDLEADNDSDHDNDNGEEEFSDWSGLSGDELDHDDAREESRKNEAFESLASRSDDSNASDSVIIEKEESSEHKARDFKNWAREQSGLGPFPSNISTLPDISPRIGRAAILVDKVGGPKPDERQLKREKVQG